jgi:hypothetical protein
MKQLSKKTRSCNIPLRPCHIRCNFSCNAILLLRDVNLANTRLRYILLMYYSHIKQSSLINISISVELRCKLNEKLHRVTGPLLSKSHSNDAHPSTQKEEKSNDPTVV